MYSGPHIKRDGLVFGYDTGQFASTNPNFEKFKPVKGRNRFFKGKASVNYIAFQNPRIDSSYSSYTKGSGTWDSRHPNAITVYNQRGSNLSNYVNTGVGDWSNTDHAHWQFDRQLKKPVVVMHDRTGSWKAKSFGSAMGAWTNLGISAGELNEELEKTPDFVQAVANIAKREVAEAGDILDKAGNGAEKWSAAMENVQVAFGRFLSSGDFNILGFLADKLDAVADSFDVLDRGVKTARIAFNQFMEPIKQLINQSPILSKIFTFINEKISSFINLLFSPTFDRFGKFLERMSFRMAGLGGVVTEIINRFKALKRELTDLSALDFSSPIALFNSVKKKFNNVVSESTDFTTAYTDAQKRLAQALIKSKEQEIQQSARQGIFQAVWLTCPRVKLNGSIG